MGRFNPAVIQIWVFGASLGLYLGRSIYTAAFGLAIATGICILAYLLASWGQR